MPCRASNAEELRRAPGLAVEARSQLQLSLYGGACACRPAVHSVMVRLVRAGCQGIAALKVHLHAEQGDISRPAVQR